LIVVLDTGGVEGLAPIDEKRRARLRALREQADDLVLPAAVLAESVLTGNVAHDYHVGRLLETLNIRGSDGPNGHAAGALRRAAMNEGVDPPPSGVDVIVMAVANECAAQGDVHVVTSDMEDFTTLAALASNGARLSLLPA
jgi:hypothetical protein